MSKIRYVLIEDEELARKRLRELLSNYDQLHFAGEADNGKNAVELIDRVLPDVVFLDIEMPIQSGFEVLKQIDCNPAVVFITAYEQFALKAFEENSIDYLLKPVNKKRLDKTIEKLLEQQNKQVNWSKLESIIRAEQNQEEWRSITVSNGNGFIILGVEEIAFFQAEDKYVMVYDKTGKKYLLNKSLAVIENNLPEQFLRIHRGIILNFDFIQSIKKNFRSLFVFQLGDSNKTELTCSNSYLEAIKTKLNV